MLTSKRARTSAAALSAATLWLAGSDASAQRAFPSAEGFGAGTTGGRGGRVIHVTTLAEAGPGSLREALEATGARTIVFDVAGVIDLGAPNTANIFDDSPTNNVLTIRTGNVTIAGQTAPCGGITIRGRLYAEYDRAVQNIIIRHLRVRPPAWTGSGAGGEQYDSVRISINNRVVIDHVSASFGVDETVDAYEARDVTVQWSIFGEAATTGHAEGAHNYGMLNDGGRFTVHHTLFAHNRNRNPALGEGPAESINNVAYNVRHGFIHHNEAGGTFNIIGNYFKQGPNDSLIPFYFDGDPFTGVGYYLADNYVDDPGQLVASVDNPWSNTAYFSDLGAPATLRRTTVHAYSGSGYVPVTTTSSTVAYDTVLRLAGAFPRDSVDTQMITETRSTSPRAGMWGARYPSNLFAGLTTCAPPADTDRDGISDAWERSHGLDPARASDNQTPMGGYPAIEVYLEELANERIGVVAPMPDAGVVDARVADATSEDVPGVAPPPDVVAPSDVRTNDDATVAMDGSPAPDVVSRDDASGRADAPTDGSSGPSMRAGCGCRTTDAPSKRFSSLVVALALAGSLAVRRRRAAR